MDTVSSGVSNRGGPVDAALPPVPPLVPKAHSSRSRKALCRQCGRRDAPIRALDLCATCEVAIVQEVHTRVCRIQAAFELLARDGELPTKRALYDRILKEAEALHRYEVRGILTTCPPPSTLLADARAMREALERGLQEGPKPAPASGRDDLAA